MKTIQEEALFQVIKEWINQGRRQTDCGTLEITENTDLISSGILDSMGFIELMAYLEAVTEKHIDLSDADPSEFTTIRGLCRSVMEQGDQARWSLTN